MKKVGKDGVITVEESRTMDTTLEVVEGMQFDRATSPPTSSQIRNVWNACSKTSACLIHEKKISSMKDLLPRSSRREMGSRSDRRGRNRRRSARHPGCEQAPRHAPVFWR